MFGTYAGMMYAHGQYAGTLTNDYVTLTETLSVAAEAGLADFIFLNETIAVDFSNIGLTDGIEVDGWLEADYKPTQSDWTN